MAVDIAKWIDDVITGPAGLRQFRYREELRVRGPKVDQIEAAGWIIRCLANPRCEGSADVLEAIAEQRRKAADNGKS